MTLIVEVEYLTGCAVASDRAVRNKPEWPPHPQRLFSSLVAAYKECDFGEAERAALDWLEGLAPPRLCFSEAPSRDPVPVYVPVNDVSTPDSAPKDIGNALKVLPDRRIRQERFFPTVIPESRPVHFVWTDAVADDLSTHRPALERLAAEVGFWAIPDRWCEWRSSMSRPSLRWSRSHNPTSPRVLISEPSGLAGFRCWKGSMRSRSMDCDELKRRTFRGPAIVHRRTANRRISPFLALRVTGLSSSESGGVRSRWSRASR